jgi:hypothetical protein
MDIFKVVETLHRTRRLMMDHMMVLRHYGMRMMRPDARRHKEVRAAALWNEAMDKIETILISKKNHLFPYSQCPHISLIFLTHQQKVFLMTQQFIMPKSTYPTTNMQCWVVFSNETDYPILRILKKGFRHCYVIIHDGQKWLSFDPLLTRHEIIAYHDLPTDFDFPQWLKSRNLTVIKAPIGSFKSIFSPFMPQSCVASIMRVIGFHGVFVLTPWQLYKALAKHNAQKPKSSSSQMRSLFDKISVFKGDYSYG